jgi:hypothetical protein
MITAPEWFGRRRRQLAIVARSTRAVRRGVWGLRRKGERRVKRLERGHVAALNFV